jgi:serine/threonine protein kinase
VTYTAALERAGFAVETRGPWASVGETHRVQGWKIHVSSIPLEAVTLLERIAPLLSQESVSFKFAHSRSVLSALNEGSFGETQVGKFLTVYPESDEQALRLATNLVKHTAGFHGPVIMTDLRLGDVVYSRYGSFRPFILMDRLGQWYPAIYHSDGELRRDRYTIPFEPPSAVSNPFLDMANLFDGPPQRVDQKLHRSPHLFGPGYLIVDILKAHPKGSVFLALDLRTQTDVALKVLKQGRQFCLSDDLERDMRTRLRSQERLSKELRTVIPTPAADDYFEVNGNGYLPLEYIEGNTLHDIMIPMLRNCSWGSLAEDDRVRLLGYAEALAAILDAMHDAGFIHRDLSPSNVLIDHSGQVHLVDLELAHALDDPTPAYGLGTPGYMAPEQEARQPPTTAQDIFSFGCLLTLLLTGIDPQRVLFNGEKKLVDRLVALSGGAHRPLAEITACCLSNRAGSRPSIPVIRAQLDECKAAVTQQGRPASSASLHPHRSLGAAIDLEEAVIDGTRGLLFDVPRDDDTGLWLSLAADTDRRSSASRTFELHRDAHRGVAGIVYTLARLSRLGYAANLVAPRIEHAVHWLLADGTGAKRLPGLYFGEAGVTVAILEAQKAGVARPGDDVVNVPSNWLYAPLDWLDVTHGAAGQGIAAMLCETALPEAHNMTYRCAEYLVDSQEPDGSWRVPVGVDGMSGQTLSGFAHGVAGIVYFLAACSSHFGMATAEQAWRRGAEWLIRRAEETDGGASLEWPYSDSTPQRWRWWCHGSPGIALTFLRLFEETGEDDFAILATKALRVHAEDVRCTNLSQCHGLSGLGEIYLEGARILSDARWKRQAETIASTLLTLARRCPNGNLMWLVEDPYIPTGDLMVGSAGVLHFLARLLANDDALGFPLLLDPVTN